jgi:uncharacterized damage-inducible protein DinB
MDIQTYFDYHKWATDRLCNMLSDIDEEIMKNEFPNSFPSLKLTLSHLGWAECLWYHRIFGAPPSISREEWREMSTDEIISNYALFNQKLLNVLKTKDLETEVDYTNSAGNKYTTTIHEIGVHVVNHASYHRGQIVTLLHQNNLSDILAFDFIAFLRT